ncbi:hemagglutinin repeat-containing protein [Achromobacter xylosoxidans]|uniref:two-partner secretion domain-containing protein n=1 Tax=Alcaligenes xylosoxydans xylosoxydans TaxID=85698 RepID=UPI0012DD54B2|nr:hemagglutinin repeat-containing protein [Achromobacter xylosoxidans]
MESPAVIKTIATPSLQAAFNQVRMMSKLRSLMAWSVVFTQVWSPVLAQTLPISVDRSVPGAKPFVGVSNGVPVVNIAPPSAGGVSNNRYTQFNVGPSGVVLNNSGGASPSQLAGQVSGNPMLGNRHAGTILNQVTAPNPSQLLGTLEVAGNRANVIVANPAGITCNGCGFLNADRATLTTGKPRVGPDGGIGFDVTTGRLGIEGQGLNGMNLSRVDLIARTLEINAGIWANRLNVTAGASRVDYGSGAVSAQAGDGPAPTVALDTAALGGMYANSIRLIGTEAGVGVNIGGNLAALTGALSVDVNGDVRIQPSGHMQAATDLAVRSAGDVVNAGAVAAAGALALDAAGRIANDGAMSSGAGSRLVAGRFDNGGALTVGLQADGSLRPAALDVQAARIGNTGTLLAGGDALLRGDTLDLSEGQLAAGGALALDATGALVNRGGALYGASVSLHAGSVDNTLGKLTSGGALNGHVAGAIDNGGGTIAGGDTVAVDGDVFVNGTGGVVSGRAVAISGTRRIDNQDGVIQASDTARIDGGGAFHNRGGKLLGGDIALQAADVDNRNGVLQAQGKLAVASVGDLRNQDGSVYGGVADIRAAGVDNARGKMLADGELTLNAGGKIDNAGGTFAAEGAALLRAQEVANANGLIAANDLTLQAEGVLDNQSGRIDAGRELDLTAGALDNSGGRLASQGDARLQVGDLRNAEGELATAGSLALATGTLRNDGKLHAGQDLRITADALTNGAAGELIGLRGVDLAISGDLANAGLIDGGDSHIRAGSLRNSGRLYGDRIAIQAPTLLNDADAVIASRGDMDLGAGTLTNREHAMLYAADDLRIGRNLDIAGLAAGQADTVSNISATIEAGGDARIAADRIENLNPHFTSEQVQVSHADRKIYYRLENGTELLDGATTWLCDSVTTSCGKDPAFLNDDPDRSLLLPSAKYPESRYGPPFDYVPRVKGEEGVDAPIPPAYAWVRSGGVLSARVPVPRYHAGDHVWQVFGVEEPVPVPALQQGQCNTHDCAKAAAAAREEARAINKARHDELQARIRAFNADFNNRLVRNFFYYIVREDVSETRVTSWDPASIVAGGDATFTGAVFNDKSRIIAGGMLGVNGPAIDNRGAQGERRVERVGVEVHTVTRRRHRNESQATYQDTAGSERRDVPVGAVTDHAVPGDTALTAPPTRPALNPPSFAPPSRRPVARIIDIGAPGSQTVRVVTLPPVLPANKLYQVITAPDAPALVVTDRQFTGSRSAVSSDMLLRRLNQDPGLTLKRLGDGFYEQRQVAEQIMLATGSRFVGDYADNESQYKALLAAGADFAGRFDLTLGTALTEDQMRRLTGDIVWLVETTVTLPDGSRQTVLAPQVYLAVKPGDLRGDGTLIAGRDTRIDVAGDLTNSGTLGARRALVVNAGDVRNAVGAMQAGSIDLSARNDIHDLAGLLKGGAIALKAGRDITLSASTRSSASGGVSSTRIDGVSRIDAGTLDIQAGRDLSAQAAVIDATGDARIQAGNDINLTSAETRYAESFRYDSRNRAELRAATDVGTRIAAGGDLTLLAGNDVNARAADVSASGGLGVNAQRDINVLAGDSAGYTYNETYFKEKGFLSSKKTHRKSETEWTQGVSSTFGGDTVAMLAGRDITVLGSNVLGDHDVGIAVGRDLQVLAKDETYKDYQYEKVKKSGFGGGGGFSIGYSTQQRTDWMRGASGGYSASTVGSAGGNLGIDAGRNVDVMASNLLAQDGNISVAGSNVAILAGVGDARQHEYHELKQSGLTIGVAGGMLGAAQQVQGTLQQAREAKDGRLAAVKVGQAAYQVVQANRMMDAAKADNATAARKEAASAQIQISLGASKSVSETRRTQDTAFASSVMAGGDLSLMAAGEKDAAGTGNVSLIGSDLAGRNVLLAATNDLMLQSQAETATEVSTSKNSGWKVGVGIGVSDSGSGGGINIFASGYVGSGKARGNGTTHRETQVSARDNLALLSGRDTLLEGAQARADRIRADLGRNLTLASQQDSDRYDARQKQVNAGGSFSFGSMTGSAYLGASVGKTKSNYDSVVEQTGLYAGTGGYDIYVGKHTQLNGAVVASDADATKNGLSTETLGFRDIHNKAQYKSTTVGINLGMSGAFDKPNKGAALGAGPSGLSFASTSGSETGTTRAAVSAGTLAVRSDAGTGRDSTAGLSRDTAGANGSIGKIFDKDKVREQLEFQQAFGQLGMQIAGDVADRFTAHDQELWGEGKPGRMALHAAIAGIGAALGGGDVAGALSGTLAGDAASNLLRDQVNQAVAGLPADARDQVSKVILNVVASAAGGATGGMSGASGASLADMYNRQLHPDEGSLIRKSAKRYAEKNGISVSQAEAELTAQALRQTDSWAAEHYDENQKARAFLAEIASGTQGPGFVYFDGNADASYGHALVFAGGIKENADLAELYDRAGAWRQAGKRSPRNVLTGSNLALVEAAQDVDSFSTHPDDVAKLIRTLQDEREIAQRAEKYPLVGVFDSTLATIDIIQRGGEYDLGSLPIENRIGIGLALNAGLEGTLSIGQLRGIVAKGKASIASTIGLKATGNPLVDAETAALDRIARNPKGPDHENKAPNSVVNAQALIDLKAGKLPGTPGKDLGSPRSMPASANPNATAEHFAEQIFDGARIDKLLLDDCPGCWRAEAADGTWVTYRPGGQASARTSSTTATVEVNNDTIRALNADKNGEGNVLKLKFPMKK